MPQILTLDVNDVDTWIAGLGAGARIELQRDTTSAFAAPTQLSNITLVAGQTQYRPFDAAGDSTNWYRYRLTTSVGGSPTAWTTWLAGAPTAYASVPALREVLALPDNSRDNLLDDYLVRATAMINAQLSFDFFRHPAGSGTEVRLYDALTNTNVIYEPQGIQPTPAPTVRMAYYTGGPFTSLNAGDTFLRYPATGQIGGPGPYLKLQMTNIPNTIGYFVRGFGTVEITGVFGYLAIPDDVVEATLAWAEDLFRLGPGGGLPSTALGATEGAYPRFVGGMPRRTYDVIQSYLSARQALWVA